METLSFSAIYISPKLSVKPHETHLQTAFTSSKFSISRHNRSCLTNFVSSLSSSSCISIPSARTRAATTSLSYTKTENCHWMVIMVKPRQTLNTKQEIVDYNAKTLETVLGREKDARMCIYNASYDTHFGFCRDIAEETFRELARLPGILFVSSYPVYNSAQKDYSSNIQSSDWQNSQLGSTPLFPAGTTKHRLVPMHKPGVGVVTKAQMVDYYTQILTKVLGNEKDAQMCIYHVSWQSSFGFCCELDEECARELAGVLSVQQDENFGSENKNYGRPVDG